jgi:hypothetical protein
MTPSVTALALRSAVARISEMACGNRPSSLTTVAKVTAGEPIYLVLVDIDHRAALRRYLARHLSIMPSMGNASDMMFSQAEATKIILESATRYRAA